MDLFAELEKLRRSHYINEDDNYYSCPKAETCHQDGTEDCDCGADKHNETLDRIIEYLNQFSS